MKRLISFLLTIVMTIMTIASPQSLAQTADQAPELNTISLDKAAFYKKMLSPAGLDVELDLAKGLAYAKDKRSGRRLFAIPIIKDKNTLNDFLPKNLPKTLARISKDALTEIPFQTYRGAKATVKAGIQSLVTFPAEAAFFYMIVGAITAQELMTRYEDSPLAIEDFTHELSPAGLFGFYLFISGSHLTQNLLRHSIKNPAFNRYATPFIGLAAGSFLQSVASNILYNPNFDACMSEILPNMPKRKNIFTGQAAVIAKSVAPQASSDDPCDALMTDVGNGQYVKSIVSLLAASALSSGTQIALAVANKQIPVLGRITLTLGKGLPFLQTQWWAKGVQLVIFLKWISFIEEPFNYAWDTVKAQGPLNDVNNQLVRDIVSAKKTNWKSTAQVSQTLQSFETNFNDWTLANSTSFLTPYDSWMRLLEGVTNYHRVALDFYAVFAKAMDSIGTSSDLFTKPNPFQGVMPQGLQPEQMFMFYDQNAEVTAAQSKLVQQAAARLQKYLQTDAKTMLPRLSAVNLQTLRDIQSKLASSDYNTQAQGLTLMQANRSAQIKQILADLQETLGTPSPRMEYGSGLVSTLKYFYFSPALGDGGSYDLLMKESNRLMNGTMSFENPEDYFIYNMICGPDIEKGQTTTRKFIKGMGYQFTPPKITLDGDYLYFKHNLGLGTTDVPFCKPGNMGKSTYAQLYQTKILVKRPNSIKVQEYSNAVEYLVKNTRFKSKNYIDQMYDWWHSTVDKELASVMAKEGGEFNRIIAKMLEHMYQRRDERWNNGPLANGGLWQLKQKLRLYMMILGELYTDNYVQQKSNEIPPTLLSANANSIPAVGFFNSIKESGTNNIPPLLRLLQGSTTLDFDRLMWMYPDTYKFGYIKKIGDPLHNHRLSAQQEVEDAFDAYAIVFMKAKAHEADNGIKIESPITAQEVNAASARMSSALQNFASLFEEGENISKSSSPIVALSEGEAQLAGDCLMAIQGVTILLGNYARMVNLANSDFLAEVNPEDSGSSGDLSDLSKAAKKMGGYTRPGQH